MTNQEIVDAAKGTFNDIALTICEDLSFTSQAQVDLFVRTLNANLTRAKFVFGTTEEEEGEVINFVDLQQQ